jgi:hypothetical protein
MLLGVAAAGMGCSWKSGVVKSTSSHKPRISPQWHAAFPVGHCPLLSSVWVPIL